MRQASWYICFHSASGSTFTSTSFKCSTPSPGLSGAVAEAMTYSGNGGVLPGRGGPFSPPPRTMRSNIFSPFAEISKPPTPSASFSSLRVFSSNFESVPPAGPPGPPPRPASTI